MIRTIGIALWAAAVALGAERGVVLMEAKREAARAAALKPPEAKIETRKAKPLSVPISRGGEMRGYVVMNLAYMVDAGAAAALGRDIEPYLLDEAFSALYADQSFDADHLDAYDLTRFKTRLNERLNERLGAAVVRDVLVQEFNYVAVADMRK
jgi:hypothetical protein